MPAVAISSSTLASARVRLQAAARGYAGRYALARLLPGLAAGGLLLVLATRWPAGWPLWLALAGASLALVAWQLAPLRRWTAAAAATRLNRRYPELQDSAGLLLAEADALPLLPRLQQQRVAETLLTLPGGGAGWLPVSFRSAGLLAALLAAGALVAGRWPAASTAGPAVVAVRFRPDPALPRPTPPGPARIERVRVLVTPPAYTRRAAFGPAGASFACPAGSRVRWLVQVSRPGAAPVLELGARPVSLSPAPGRRAEYVAEQTLLASTLYRLRVAGQVSDDYAIEVRLDQPPTVRLTAPGAHVLVPARGTRPVVPLQASLGDDYGLARAELVLTIATGEGEAVKFREVRRDLGAALTGQPTRAAVRQSLSLPGLGLHPGDELYVYVQAQDSRGQRTRSDTHLVQWQDSAAAASALSLGLGMNTAPAYFRSQRQLIIDTEKLLAERRKLSAVEFAARANSLGIDQQALRLRYGKFLGEEAEKGMGPAAGPPVADEPALPTAEDAASPTADAHPDEHSGADDHDEHDHNHGGKPRDDSPTAATDALLDAYVHKHDDAETADFLEPAVKAKLHAVLDEMWAAELRLRTAQPAAARPYEYRALRLLKEVQQQTRAYVRKAGLTPQPAPEAALRLTGELKGAAAPRTRTIVPAPPAQPAVRTALRLLAAARAGQALPASAAPTLDQANAALAVVAVQRPGFYLPALRALRTLAAAARAGRSPTPADLTAAEQGLTELLPAPPPTTAPSPTPDRLARRYWQELGE